MTITCNISGAPKFTTVSTSAALLSAINSAKAGQIITLDTVVAAFILTTTNVIARPGCVVVLPATQIVKTSLSGAAGIRIIGGIHSADQYSGTVGSDYSVNIQSCTRIGMYGFTLGQGDSGINAVSCTDLDIGSFLGEWTIADVLDVTGCTRSRIASGYVRHNIHGQQILWYDNGTLPQDAVGNGGGTYPYYDNAPVHWNDTAHCDGLQFRLANVDLTIQNNDFNIVGQGIVDFGSGGDSVTRALIDGNVVRTTAGSGIYVGSAGQTVQDITMTSNTVGEHLYETPSSTVQCTLVRNGTVRLQGGMNTALTGAQLFSPSGVTLGSGTLNGDASVVQPTPPALGDLPWMPSYSRPAYVPHTAAPYAIVPPEIYHTRNNAPPANPSSGVYLTIGRGRVKGLGGETMEVRWRKNGSIIGGQTARVLQATGVATDSFVGEVRHTDANGTGAWVASAAVVLG